MIWALLFLITGSGLQYVGNTSLSRLGIFIICSRCLTFEGRDNLCWKPKQFATEDYKKINN